METRCYIVEVRAQPVVVIAQLDKHLLLLVEQPLHLVRLCFPVQLLHNMKCFILLPDLNQLGIPELRHLIDRL